MFNARFLPSPPALSPNPSPTSGRGEQNLWKRWGSGFPSPACGRGCPKGGRGQFFAPLSRLRERGWGRGKVFLALVLTCLASSAFAADGAIHAVSTNHSETLSKILLGLLLVLALITALTWLLKRLPINKSSGGHIRLIESYPLSTRERLLLVAVGSEQILLAASNVGIKPLHVLREPLPQTSTTSDSAFAAQLAQCLPSLQRGRT